MRPGPILGIIALVAVAIGIAALSSRLHPGGELPPNEQQDAAQTDTSQPKTPPKPAVNPRDPKVQAAFAKYAAGAIHAMLAVEGKGDIQLELYPKAAPQTVAHFVDLCKRGFYNGILFHRVVKDFVAQAGDPNSKNVDGSKLRAISDQEVGAEYHLGTGGSGQNIPFERNDLVNLPGTLAMALNSPQSATGDSQFFINLKYNSNLDGDYCVFGKVVSGMDVVNSIQQGDKIQSITVH